MALVGCEPKSLIIHKIQPQTLIFLAFFSFFLWFTHKTQPATQTQTLENLFHQETGVQSVLQKKIQKNQQFRWKRFCLLQASGGSTLIP